MFKRLGAWVLCLGLLLGSTAQAASTKRLTESEKDHFYAVKVFMGDKEQKKWLKLKTEDARTAWMKKRGLWERFYQFDEDRRNKIVAGEVEVPTAFLREDSFYRLRLSEPRKKKTWGKVKTFFVPGRFLFLLTPQHENSFCQILDF